MSSRRLVILGAGGLARETLTVAEALAASGEPLEVVGYIDEHPERHGQSLCERPVLGGFDWLERHAGEPHLELVCAVGNPPARRRLCERAAQLGYRFATLIHPSVERSRFVSIGEGCIIQQACSLTTQVSVGRHVVLNPAVTLAHDVVVADYCNLAPGAHVSGNVRMQEGVDLGTGAVLLQGLSIGAWSVIGAGAVVIRDLPPRVTAVGVPARVIKEHAE